MKVTLRKCENIAGKRELLATSIFSVFPTMFSKANFSMVAKTQAIS